jgi:hypothetical protein
MVGTGERFMASLTKEQIDILRDLLVLASYPNAEIMSDSEILAYHAGMQIDSKRRQIVAVKAMINDVLGEHEAGSIQVTV